MGKKKLKRIAEKDFNELVNKIGFGPVSPPQQKQLEEIFYKYGEKRREGKDMEKKELKRIAEELASTTLKKIFEVIDENSTEGWDGKHIRALFWIYCEDERVEKEKMELLRNYSV